MYTERRQLEGGRMQVVFVRPRPGTVRPRVVFTDHFVVSSKHEAPNCARILLPALRAEWVYEFLYKVLANNVRGITKFFTFQWTAYAQCSEILITGRSTGSFSVFKDHANTCWARTASVGRLASGWPTTREIRKIRLGRKRFRWECVLKRYRYYYILPHSIDVMVFTFFSHFLLSAIHRPADWKWTWVRTRGSKLTDNGCRYRTRGATNWPYPTWMTPCWLKPGSGCQSSGTAEDFWKYRYRQGIKVRRLNVTERILNFATIVFSYTDVWTIAGDLCGLCGNFNSMPRDDMTTRDGQVVLEPQVFGSSWRVGGKNACSRPLKPITHASPCSRKGPRNRERMCKPLRQRMFAACHKKLNPVNFFKCVPTEIETNYNTDDGK